MAQESRLPEDSFIDLWISVTGTLGGDYLVETYATVDGTLGSQVLHTSQDGTWVVTQLACAFGSIVKTSTTTTRRATHTFFYNYVAQVIEGVRLLLPSLFLKFDHGNDDEPCFDEQYLCSVKEVQIDCVDRIRHAIQQQFRNQLDNSAIERLLEESDVLSLLRSASPESLLADSITEDRLIAVRERSGFGDAEASNTLERFKLSFAQYAVRKQGLKVQHNQQLVSRTREEIHSRTPALGKPTPVADEDLTPTGHGDENVNTYSHRNKIQRFESSRIWNHITISRDETSASNFLHERLVILFLDRSFACINQSEREERSIKNTEAPDLAKQEQHSVSSAAPPRRGAMAENYPSHQAARHQTSVAQPPNTKSSNASSSKHMDSRNRKCSTIDGNQCGDMQTHQSVSNVTSIGLEKRLTEETGPSMHEN